jgi:tetratricopeptide (TPR) repeat protein
MLGDIAGARAEIAQGLGALAGQPRDTVATHAAWLHNLEALTHFQQKDLASAQRAEGRALACIDHAPGPSATHLKTNLVSNFSVLYEAKGDLPMATAIWQSFAALNAKLGSHAADKVYLNRLGALHREAGAIDAALDAYRGAFDKAEITGDAFHAETIAGAIARVYLDRNGLGDREHAENWYRVAAERARTCGDCVQLARHLAGASIASTREEFSEAREALSRDVTYNGQAEGLDAALRTNSAKVIRGELPRGKSKLSRPFTLINL